ncbi:hypothetical protein CAEBREN_06255 [Caenorhabditis brenneri]|uniref:Uncharacterized protein n=1 Tax=Caenorhabditis brenneri TaxID=135651 RepID=G0MPK2_CAEBE|nr:hypothetical protein CAEBREN_06255 [Caenorhabditis brenneri]
MPRCLSKDFCRKGFSFKAVNHSEEQRKTEERALPQEDATPSQPDYVDFDCDEQTEQLSSSENTDDEEDVYEEYTRFLSAHDNKFEEDVKKLWEKRRRLYTTCFFCNVCGLQCYGMQKCCGPLVKFVRIGVMTQLQDIVSQNYEQIVNLRQKLKSGRGKEHNLTAPFLSERWKRETDKELKLSALLSVDGISIPGNKKKLWPVSMLLLDLPTSEMQKSSNVLLEGIAECSSNPSTKFWNSVYPLIKADTESSSRKVRGHAIELKIVTSNSDQPVRFQEKNGASVNFSFQAKRSLFGMRAHQSAFSCFYCLSPGTLYKDAGRARCELREGMKTLEDSKNGQRGFSGVYSKILESVLPYNTPIDVLHGFGEGIFAVILNELFATCTIAKSDMFTVDVEVLKNILPEVVTPSIYSNVQNCRNGTDRLNFFRIVIFAIAIKSDLVSPKGRCVIIALSILVNRMYGFHSNPPLFDEKICGASAWFLKEASEQYLTIKAHEIIFHLPQVNRQFGNVATISTFCFESSYQFSFMGYSTRMTRNFCETACTRVLLHNTMRREVIERSKRNNTSKRFQMFLSATKGIAPFKYSYDRPIRFLKNEDILEEMDSEDVFFASLSISAGNLRSEYYEKNSRDDVFFAKGRDRSGCYRFVAFCPRDKGPFVLAEKLLELPEMQQYISFHESIGKLCGTDLYYGLEVMKMLRSFEGVTYCKRSGKRRMIDFRTIKSIASYIDCGDAFFVISCNGTHVHN